MIEKELLTVNKSLTEDIVAMSDAQSIYVDDLWFKKKMHEKSFKNKEGEKVHNDFKNFPIEVKAIKIRWFINSDYGKKFLIQILNNENIELYNIQTLRIIIEYFYQKYIHFLFKFDFPLFVVKAIIFAMILTINEWHNDNSRNKKP